MPKNLTGDRLPENIIPTARSRSMMRQIICPMPYDGSFAVVCVDETDIHWNKAYSPIKHQLSTSTNGPWHGTCATNDEYRRESFDGGTTWEAPYKLVGKDGRPGSDGSDANVTFNNIKSALSKAYGTQTSFMTVNEMGAPEIFGGKIYGAEIYAGYAGGGGTGSVISLTDDGIQMTNKRNDTNLQISSMKAGTYGTITMLSGGTAGLYLNGQTLFFGNNMGASSASGIAYQNFATYFFGKMDFTQATTTGLHATLA